MDDNGVWTKQRNSSASWCHAPTKRQLLSQQNASSYMLVKDGIADTAALPRRGPGALRLGNQCRSKRPKVEFSQLIADVTRHAHEVTVLQHWPIPLGTHDSSSAIRLEPSQRVSHDPADVRFYIQKGRKQGHVGHATNEHERYIVRGFRYRKTVNYSGSRIVGYGPQGPSCGSAGP